MPLHSLPSRLCDNRHHTVEMSVASRHVRTYCTRPAWRSATRASPLSFVFTAPPALNRFSSRPLTCGTFLPRLSAAAVRSTHSSTDGTRNGTSSTHSKLSSAPPTPTQTTGECHPPRLRCFCSGNDNDDRRSHLSEWLLCVMSVCSEGGAVSADVWRRQAEEYRDGRKSHTTGGQTRCTAGSTTRQQTNRHPPCTIPRVPFFHCRVADTTFYCFDSCLSLTE